MVDVFVNLIVSFTTADSWMVDIQAQIKHWQLERKILQLKDELKAEVENVFYQSSI